MDRELRIKTRYKCILGETEGDGSRGELLFLKNTEQFWKFGESKGKEFERMRVCKFYYSMKSRENMV